MVRSLANSANVAYTLQTMFLNNCKNNSSTFGGGGEGDGWEFSQGRDQTWKSPIQVVKSWQNDEHLGKRTLP